MAKIWDVFISHASEDKGTVAGPLAQELQQRGFRVWFDQFELTLGDSLRRSIDRGLRDSRFGVVVLSPTFFSKEWPQRELDGLSAKEIDGEKVILPVWHQVSRSDVLNYSPILADRLAVSTASGIPATADAIEGALRRRTSATAVDEPAVKTPVLPPAESRSGPRRWRRLGHCMYPMLSNSEAARASFVSDLAFCLVKAERKNGYLIATSLLWTEQHDTEAEPVVSLSLTTHLPGLAETLQRRHVSFLSAIQRAQASPDPLQARQEMRELIAAELREFEHHWNIRAHIEFTEHPSAIEMIVDERSASVSLRTLEPSTDIAAYPHRLDTTSEMLHFAASAGSHRAIVIRNADWLSRQYKTAKLYAHLLDEHAIDFQRILVDADDPETWEYENPDYDAEIGKYET